MKDSAYVDADLALALDADNGITWYKNRKIRRGLKQAGIQCQSEAAMRKRKREILADELISKTLPFEFKDDKDGASVDSIITKNKAVVHVKCLREFTRRLLDRYDQSNRLVWHDGMPKNEIWIKAGGDKGKGSFKFCIQVVNQKAPNAANNTVPVICFEAPDSYNNLAMILPQFAEEIKQLMGDEWNGYIIRLIGVGDIEFVNCSEGQQKASCTHPCFLCYISKDEMQIPRDERELSEKRTLESNKRHFTDFQNAGAKIRDAAKYFNCINPPLVPIEPSDYIVPYVHLLLGIVPLHFQTILLQALHRLDLKLVDYLVNHGQYPFKNTLFERYVYDQRLCKELPDSIKNLQKEISKMECEKDDEVFDPEDRKKHAKDLSELIKKQKNAEKELKRASESTLTVGQGPIAAVTDEILKRFHIERQPYHGGMFIGNHCDRFLMEDVQRALALGIVNEVKSKVPQNKQMIKEAKSIVVKHKCLNMLYARVHNLVKHSRPIPASDLPTIQSAVNEYLAFYRKYFDHSVIPKQHILEDHLVECIEKFKMGFGFLSEQGHESIHHVIKELHNHFEATKPDHKRLLQTVEAHVLAGCPELRGKIPEIKRRKRRKISRKKKKVGL